MTASSNDVGYCRAISVWRGSPKTVMYSCTCCASSSVGSRQERAMRRVLYSLTVLVHRSMPSSSRAVSEGQAEAGVDEFHKLIPRWLPAVEFYAMEPHLRVVEEVEEGERHPLMIRRSTRMEIMVTTI
jgi:hypothetical protein